MDEKTLMEFLCSGNGFEKENVQKILDSNAPCKRCLIIPGPGKFFNFSTEFAKKSTDHNNCIEQYLGPF